MEFRHAYEVSYVQCYVYVMLYVYVCIHVLFMCLFWIIPVSAKNLKLFDIIIILFILWKPSDLLSMVNVI